MELINNTPLQIGFTLGMNPEGREAAVVAIKGTYSIPLARSEAPELLDEQIPLIEADVFSAEPGLSSPLFEVDFSPFKPRCDITIVGSAYAPGGKPAERVQTGFKIGESTKLVDVIGERFWVTSNSGIATSQPVPFEVRPITYDIAFGGTDRAHDDDKKHDAYMANPVGIGFHKALDKRLLEGAPVASTECPGEPITRPDGIYRPMSFGPLGRGWEPRLAYGGTYDDQWIEESFPFLPKDFDNRYYQSAPEDQQADYLKGGEIVRLVNVTPEGRCQFQIPTVEMPVCFFRKKSQRMEKSAVLDTLVIEPDARRFTLTWRASLALKRNLFELPEIRVGK